MQTPGARSGEGYLGREIQMLWAVKTISQGTCPTVPPMLVTTSKTFPTQDTSSEEEG